MFQENKMWHYLLLAHLWPTHYCCCLHSNAYLPLQSVCARVWHLESGAVWTFEYTCFRIHVIHQHQHQQSATLTARPFVREDSTPEMVLLCACILLLCATIATGCCAVKSRHVRGFDTRNQVWAFAFPPQAHLTLFWQCRQHNALNAYKVGLLWASILMCATVATCLFVQLPCSGNADSILHSEHTREDYFE